MRQKQSMDVGLVPRSSLPLPPFLKGPPGSEDVITEEGKGSERGREEGLEELKSIVVRFVVRGAFRTLHLFLPPLSLYFGSFISIPPSPA